jgi:DNA polymerase-4
MIVFIQVPGFYAAVEQTDRVELRGAPVIVGGDPRKRGAVTSASPEALAAGVRPGMETAEALELCPGAHVRPTRIKRYREVAGQIRELIRGATDRIEELGLDGTFLQAQTAGDPLQLAASLCVRIQGELGLRAVAGIAPTRFAAYLAARAPGPGGIALVASEDLPGFLGRFSVSEIWGLGPATAARLDELHVKTIADLRELSAEELRPIAGRNAQAFLDLAHGRADEPLRPRPRSKSLSQEQTLAQPTADLRGLGEALLELARRLEAVLARERRAARTVALWVSYVDGTQVTRTATQERALAGHNEIHDAALALLGRTQAGVRHVRRLRLQLSNLARVESAAQPEQLRLL